MHLSANVNWRMCLRYRLTWYRPAHHRIALVSVRAVSSIDLAVQREILVQELKDFREAEECLKDALDLSKVQVDRQALVG